MNRSSHRLTLSIATLGLALMATILLALPTSAHAWIFSGDVLIHKVGVARRTLDLDKNLLPERGKGRLTSLEAKGFITLGGQDAQHAAKALETEVSPLTGELHLDATVRYAIPGKCGLELTVPNSKNGLKITVANRKGAIHVEGGEGRIETLYMFAELVCPIMDGRGSYNGPLDLVKAAKVNRYKVSLGRAERDQLAYVIGGTAKTEASTFWVAKDIFQPLRFVDRSHQITREVRLSNYDTQATGRWHPKRTEFFVAGKSVGVLIIDSAQPNVRFAPDVL